MVRVHRVGGEADGVVAHAAREAMALGHGLHAAQPARFAHVQERRPAAGGAELVLGRAAAPDLVAHRLRHARMVRQRPHESLLPAQVRRPQLVAPGVRRLGPLPVGADEVGRNRAVVVRVRLAVGHPQRMPGRHRRARVEVAEQQFIVALVVAGRLRPRQAVGRVVRDAHAEAVGLDAPVAGAVRPWRGLDARQQAAGRLAFHAPGLHRELELVLVRLRSLRAVQGLAVFGVRFAPDRVRGARSGQQVALVAAVEPLRRFDARAVFAVRGDDARAVLLDSALTAVEARAQGDHARFGQPLVEDAGRDRRLERPGRVVAFGMAVAAREVGVSRLARPGRGGVVVRLHGLVEAPRPPADGGLVADVGGAEAAGRQPADVEVAVDQRDRAAHAHGLQSSDDAGRGGAVDAHVGAHGGSGAGSGCAAGCAGAEEGEHESEERQGHRRRA